MSETTASRIPTISRVSLIIALFVSLILCLVLLIQIQMNALTAIRAYVGGEGLWAKAQKDAVRSLEQYVISSDEADFQSYRRFIQVPLGDMQARIELQKSKPNLDIAREGLLQGRNHPVDVEYMIAFFRRFQDTAYMTQAIGHWAAADRLIAELNGVAEKLHKEMASGRDKPAAVRALLTRLDPINLQVTVQEDLFSSTLADASRWANDVSRNLTYAIALLFVALGIGLSWPLISRIRTTEKALSESEERLRSIYDHVDDIILTVESDGILSSISPSSERMIGWSPDELISRPFSLFIQPDDLPHTKELLMKAQAGEPLPVFQVRILTKAGGYLETEIVVNAVHRGRSITLLGVVRDITERKQTEADHRIAATAFESQEGMMITDASSVILRVNRAFTEITGYTAEEAVGQTPRLLKSDRHNAAFFATMWARIKHTGGWQGEIWDRRKNGEIYPKWLTITAVKSDEGTVTHYVGTHTDITARKAAEEKIMHLAFYDPLTQLPNRRLLLDRLQQALASSARNGLRGALLFIDLDHFKTLNDTLGHDKGDLLLQQVAQRLAACVREGDTVARLGGDEFVVLLEGLSKHPEEAAPQAETVGEKILATLNQPYQLAGYENRSTPSIGVTLFGGHQTSIEELLKQADLAMYQAKAAGRNTLRFFDPQMQAIVTNRAALEVELREAVSQQQFILYYQPQVAGDGRLTGAEALLRWQHPQRGLVSPADFIPLAEETGLILPLGQWVLETACTQLAKWAVQPDTAHLSLAVNVSAKQLHQSDFVDQVLAVLASTGANPYQLKLELTESLLVSHVENTIAKMTALKAQGVGFSLDDFGTGYSSLSYLKRLPLDQLKIDQGFVRDILIDPNDAAIAKMIVALAESLGLSVIAEGVEIEAQRDFLARLGCHAYQGYLFSRPLPLESYEQFAQRV